MRFHGPLAALFFTLACNSDNTPAPATDAAPAVDVYTELDLPRVTDVGVDVPRDVGVDAGAAPSYGPCAAAADCRGVTGSTCIAVSDGYPQGYCSRTCTTDAQCGDGLCLAFGTRHVCFKHCDVAGDCRSGYNCFVASGSGDTARYACFPFCTDDAQCPQSACNRYTRFCGVCDAAGIAAGTCTVLDTARADNGSTCGQNFDCRSGNCFEEFNATTGDPTGYLGGLCYSRCTVPADSAYNGSTYPQGDCPGGSVCAREAGQAAGETARCRQSCASTADCRGGYICLKAARPDADAGTYDNGYCAPLNCHYMTQACPSDATCQTTRSDDAGVPVSGFCVRPMGVDGGTTDAGVDASAGDAGVDASAGDVGGDVTGDAGAADGG